MDFGLVTKKNKTKKLARLYTSKKSIVIDTFENYSACHNKIMWLPRAIDTGKLEKTAILNA